MTEETQVPVWEVADGVWAVPAPLPGDTTVWCYVIRGDRLTLVDSGFHEHVGEVLEPALNFIGGGLKAVARVLLTHGHADHAGGAAVIHSVGGARLVLHANDACARTDLTTYLASGLDLAAGLPSGTPQFDARREFLAAHDRFGKIYSEVRGGEQIDIGSGRTLIVIETPGHTPGSVSYLLLPERIMFAGDSIQGLGGRHGIPFYGDATRYVQSVDTVGGLQPNIMCLGHRYAWRSHSFNVASAVRRGHDVGATIEDSLTPPALIDTALRDDPNLRYRSPAEILTAAGLPFDGSAPATLTVRAHVESFEQTASLPI